VDLFIIHKCISVKKCHTKHSPFDQLSSHNKMENQQPIKFMFQISRFFAIVPANAGLRWKLFMFFSVFIVNITFVILAIVSAVYSDDVDDFTKVILFTPAVVMMLSYAIVM